MATHDAAQLAGPSRPLGSPEIPQFYLPSSLVSGIYEPHLYGVARVHFADRRRKIDLTRRAAFVVPLETGMRSVDWDRAIAVDSMPEDLLAAAPVPASYRTLPSGAMKVPTFTRWAKSFDRWLARTQRLSLPAEMTEAGEPGEPVQLRPKRGGVSVELVAIVWDLVPADRA